MKDLHTTRRQILKGAAAAGVLGALGVPAAGFADGEDEGRRVRWDLILVGSGCVAPGGRASARSNDGSSHSLHSGRTCEARARFRTPGTSAGKT